MYISENWRYGGQYRILQIINNDKYNWGHQSSNVASVFTISQGTLKIFSIPFTKTSIE